MIATLLLIIEIILLAYLAFNVLYVAIFSFGGIIYKATNFNAVKIQKQHRFAVLIPAYKHDEVILNTVGHCLNQNYPSDKFQVIVIADSLQKLTLGELSVLPITLIKVSFDESTKAKSINTALAQINIDDYDYCVVLDVDNIMEKNFLAKINARLQDNQMVIQGHRTAKNLDTAFSILDGISEEINNHIFRKGHVALGVTSALSGSGQAMQIKAFKEAMSNIHSAVEDKDLEYYLLRNGHKVLYENDALVFDEKVQNSKVFTSQRKRWISSQFYEMNKVLAEGVKDLLFNGKFDFFDKGLQRVIMPRVLLLGFSFFCALFYFIPFIQLGKYFLALFIINCLSYIVAIPSSYFNLNTLKAALRLPLAFFLMFFAMIKSKGNSKKFVHTEHTATVKAPKS
jgi:cellulose synthase/poly-beta-1,6-N-acetylglucosamine synthase-like glycosyltransferase